MSVITLNDTILQAREDYLRRYELRKEYDLTFTSVLGIEFVAQPHHFRSSSDGGSKAMVLKCSSSLLSVYWQSSEVSDREVTRIMTSMGQSPVTMLVRMRVCSGHGTLDWRKSTVSSKNDTL